MIFRIKNKTRRLRAYEAACSCAQPKKMIFLEVGNVDDGTAQPVKCECLVKGDQGVPGETER